MDLGSMGKKYTYDKMEERNQSRDQKEGPKDTFLKCKLQNICVSVSFMEEGIYELAQQR